jgi:hypothetical protein
LAKGGFWKACKEIVDFIIFSDGRADTAGNGTLEESYVAGKP